LTSSTPLLVLTSISVVSMADPDQLVISSMMR